MFGEEYTLVAVADYVLKNISEETLKTLNFRKYSIKPILYPRFA
jgi:hypothetical protein